MTEKDREKVNGIAQGIISPDYNVKKLITNPEVKQGIADLLERDGITLTSLNKTLKQQLRAKKVIYHDLKAIREEIPDWDNIDKGLTKGYKLYGVLKDNNVNIDNRQVTFSGDVNKLLEVVKELKDVKARIATDTTGEVI
jgi:hypothetical protein